MLTLSEAIGGLERALVAEKAWRERHDYPLNRFWGGGNQETMHEVLIAGNSPEDVVARVLSTGLYTHHAFEARVDGSIDWHLRVYPELGLQIDSLPPAVQESPLFPSSQSRQRGSRRMSPDFFRHCVVAGGLPARCGRGPAGQGSWSSVRVAKRLPPFCAGPGAPPHTSYAIFPR